MDFSASSRFVRTRILVDIPLDLQALNSVYRMSHNVFALLGGPLYMVLVLSVGVVLCSGSEFCARHLCLVIWKHIFSTDAVKSLCLVFLNKVTGRV